MHARASQPATARGTRTPAPADGARMPPGPRVPALLGTLALQRDPVGVLRRATARYGETFSFPLLPPGTVVVTSSPALVERMLTGEAAEFRAGAATHCLLPILGERSLIVRDGDHHRGRRRAMLPAFSPQGLEPWTPAIERLVADHVERWPRRRTFAVLPLARKLAFDVIAMVGGILGTGLERAIEARLGTLASPPVGPAIWLPRLRRRFHGFGPWAVLDRRVAAIDALLTRALGRRLRVGDAPSVADHLIDLRDQGALASDAEMIEELRTLLLVGHETATAAIAWTLLTLAWHPDPPRHGDDLRYAKAVVHEALRLYPPVVDVVRELAGPLDHGPYRIPAGTVLMAAPSLVHRRPDLYDAPGEFRPERFLDQRPEPFAWIPFGGGKRRCLGAALAQLELRAVLRTVTTSDRLRPGSPDREAARLNGTTLLPARGARIILEPLANATRTGVSATGHPRA